MNKVKFDLAHIAQFKGSGLPLAAYCKAKGINMSALQYHLAKERRTGQEAVTKFVPVSRAATPEWFTLQIGSAGLRIRFNADFTI